MSGYLIALGLTVFLGLFVIRRSIIELQTRKELKRVLRAFASEKGLEFRGGFWPKNWYVRGNYRGVPLNITVERDMYAQSFALTLGFEAPYSQRDGHYLEIRPKKTGEQWGHGGLATGDLLFDQVAWVNSSSTSYALAYLNRELRSIVANLIQGSNIDFSADKSSVRCRNGANNFKTVRQLETVCDDIVNVSALLSREEAPATLMRRNFADESEAAVKIALLEALHHSERDLEMEDPTIQESLKSSDMGLRFTAVRLLGSKGYSLIPKLFPDCWDDYQVQILGYVTEHQVTELLPFFLEVAQRATYPRVKRALVRYFDVTSYEKAEPFLRTELESNEPRTTEYTNALIRALGCCGTYASIEILDKRKTPENARRIDYSIAQIQHRIGAGDGGWLSMQKPEEEEGWISLPTKGEEQT